MKFILTVIFSFIFLVSGFSQTRNVVVGTNDVIVQPTNFWSANASNGRTGLGLGSAATNPASAFQPSSAVLSNLANNNGSSLTNISVSNIVGVLATNGNGSGLTNLTAANITGTVALASNVTGTVAISNGGIGATTAGGARTNLGLGSTDIVQLEGVVANAIYSGTNTTNDIVLDTQNLTIYAQANQVFYWDTNFVNFNVPVQFNNTTNVATTRTNLGLGATWLTNVVASNFRTAIGLGVTNDVQFARVFVNGVFEAASNRVEVFQPVLIADRDSTNDVFQFEIGSDRAIARTNLGLGWSALTNTNAGTSFVSVNTNGEVVSPTNFWQVAPIQTVVQNLAPITNSTNAATNARNLYVYSLATNITGVTNTVTLPTNTSTFAGDSATIIHQGTTSSVTAVRQAGAGSNLITINRFDESVKFIYENNSWTTYHNISFQEPIYFSGTNVSANAAASRTNLGLGTTNNVAFGSIALAAGDIVISNNAIYWGGDLKYEIETTTFYSPLAIDGATNIAITRTNLGLGFSALTNTNAAGFQRAIFTTNAAPTNSANINTVNFNTAVAWIEISVVTNSVTNSYRIPVFQ